MPHDKKGVEVRQGDYVKGFLGGSTEKVGLVCFVTPNCDSCNALVSHTVLLDETLLSGYGYTGETFRAADGKLYMAKHTLSWVTIKDVEKVLL